MDQFSTQPERKGFSPIELLAVILMIGILTLVAVSFLNDARAKARDAKRLVDITRLKTALEFYQLENGSYPQYENVITLGVEPYVKLCESAVGAFVSSGVECQTDFMAPVPLDPQRTKQYMYAGIADGYTISFSTEKESIYGAPGLYYAHSTGVDKDPTAK